MLGPLRPDALTEAGKPPQPSLLWCFSFSAGIACIALSFVDTHGCPLQGPAQDGAQRWEMCASPFHPQLFDELTTVSKVTSTNGSSASGNHRPDESRPSLRSVYLWRFTREPGSPQSDIEKTSYLSRDIPFDWEYHM